MAKRKAVVDFETDPFLYDREPRPFAGCLYFNDKDRLVVWGDGAEKEIAEAILNLPACDIYAHNGGKFDFHFLLPWANKGDVKIINGRIAEMHIGECALRDSLLLIPFALDKYKKTPIDYDLFERENREKNRDKIIDYMIDDCRNLMELLEGFHAELGNKLTIGSAAMSKMKKFGVPIEKQNEAHDKTFRQFYHGGRVEAFFVGERKKKTFCVDINGAYPHAMLSEHAHGPSEDYRIVKKLPEDFLNCFVSFLGKATGAFPYRDEKFLTFPCTGNRDFFVTGWEVNAALETGMLKIQKIHKVFVPPKTINFKKFVMPVFDERAKAKREKNKLRDLMFKTLGNSGYGKLATNPENFYDWYIGMPGEEPPTGYGPAPYGEHPTRWFWRKPISPEKYYRSFYDVATAASITGFVRAKLWIALCKIREPLYCDTDSIICGDPGALELHATELGAWKTEMVGERFVCAGKKLYGLRAKNMPDKIASKGARLDYNEIRKVALGAVVEWKNAAPTFGVKNPVHFVDRKIRAR